MIKHHFLSTLSLPHKYVHRLPLFLVLRCISSGEVFWSDQSYYIYGLRQHNFLSNWHHQESKTVGICEKKHEEISRITFDSRQYRSLYHISLD